MRRAFILLCIDGILCVERERGLLFGNIPIFGGNVDGPYLDLGPLPYTDEYARWDGSCDCYDGWSDGLAGTSQWSQTCGYYATKTNAEGEIDPPLCPQPHVGTKCQGFSAAVDDITVEYDFCMSYNGASGEDCTSYLGTGCCMGGWLSWRPVCQLPYGDGPAKSNSNYLVQGATSKEDCDRISQMLSCGDCKSKTQSDEILGALPTVAGKTGWVTMCSAAPHVHNAGPCDGISAC